MRSYNKIRASLIIILSIIFTILVFLSKPGKQELKREVIGKSYEEGKIDSIFVGSDGFMSGRSYELVTQPGQYYLIIKIYYDNNTTSVLSIPVDKETYNKN